MTEGFEHTIQPILLFNVHNKIKQKHLVNNEDECIPSDDLCFFNFFFYFFFF